MKIDKKRIEFDRKRAMDKISAIARDCRERMSTPTVKKIQRPDRVKKGDTQ